MSRTSYLPTVLRTPWPLAVGCAAIMAMLVLSGASPFTELDRRWNDFLLRARFRLDLAPKPDERVFVVGLETGDFLNARSAETEYNSYAELVDILAALEVRAVVFDLILLRGTPEDSREVRRALAAQGHGVLGAAWEQGQLRQSFPFAPGAFQSGLINVMPDPDGVYRRYSYGMASGQCSPSLALAAYLHYLDVNTAGLSCGDGALRWKQLARDGASIEQGSAPSRSVVLNFRSAFAEPWDRGFRYLTVGDLRAKFADRNDPKAATKGLPGKGDIVFIGSMTGDAGPTPFARFEPLITLHATALNDLLQARLLTETSPVWVMLLTAAGLAAIVIGSKRMSRHSLFFVCGGTAVAAILLMSAGLLVARGIVLPAITPAAFLLACMMVESGRRASVQSMETVRTRETLGRYFSPRILEDVLANPDQVEPREVELTVLLTDIRNFTTITERFGVRRTFDLLNEVFEIETGIVLDLDGSMEHFVGDQFVAYWGAPQPQPDATDRAVEAARRIVAGLERLRDACEPEVADLFGFGVALHSGKALVGNKGSKRRLDYGILGDIVNAAARIESLTKHYGVLQIASKPVVANLTAPIATRFLDRIRVKGKSEPLELHEIVYPVGGEASVVFRQYEVAWHLYAGGQFDEAIALLEPLAAADPPSGVLLARCVSFRQTEPEQWDGIFQFSEK